MTIRHEAVSTIRRGALGSALILMICAGAAAQVTQAQLQDADVDGIDAAVGTPANPEPITVIPADEPVRADRLYLSVGRVDTSGRLTAEEIARLFEEAGDEQRMVIQLDGPMTPQRRAALLDAGLPTLGYLPTNAFIVRAKDADAQRLAELDFVVWASAYEDAWKVSPELGMRTHATPERQRLAQRGQTVVNISLFRDADANASLKVINGALANAFHHKTERLGDDTVFTFTIDTVDADVLATLPVIQFIEEAPEVTLRNATTTWIAQSNILNQTPVHDRGIFGEGQIVGISDGRVDTGHCAFSDTVAIGPSHRKIEAYNTSLGADSHGTHVAGTVAGDNGSPGDLRGIAYKARFVFDTTPSFSDSGMYNMCETHHLQGARVHTNSWGNDGTTSYDGLTRGIDRFSYDYEDSLVLFAVTNTSTLRNPENAKNVLAVGASQDAPNQGSHCTAGVGPTSDGRRKPEIYLPGCGTISASSNTTCGTRSLTGTSMACPAVAGSAALVRDYFESGFYPAGIQTPGAEINPTGALVKATLLNSTVDMTGISGFPSNLEGWGRLLLDNALYFQGDARTLWVEDVRNADGLTTGQSGAYSLTVTSSSEPLNITAVWTEPPATAGTSFASTNNLDLRVVAPDGTEYKGNVFAGGQSATGGTHDDRNNVETVRVLSPQVGAWTVEIIGAGINEATQGYAIAANGALTQGPIPLIPSLNSVLPAELARLETFDVEVDIFEGDDTLVPGSVKAFVAADGVNYAPVTLTSLGGSLYGGTLGPFECDDTPRLYIEAEGSDSGVKFVAGATASNPHEIAIGETILAVEDTFELDNGWTVASTATTGAWERADPTPTEAQPGSDTTPTGTLCFVTGASATALGDNDIDNGNTILTSPAYDLSGLASATVRYNRWYSNNTGAAPNEDSMLVQVSDDGGSNWTTLETIGPAGAGTSGGWIAVELQVENFVALTSAVRFRFIASDLNSGSIVEAAIDDFQIEDFVCQGLVNTCVGDFNDDGDVDLGDFGIFAPSFGSVLGDPNWDPRADFNNDGVVNLGDFGVFGTDFGRTDCLQ
ncbi:MAG: hypothetical protein Tsb0013_15840 [Phycisphaerales bacterium]